MKFISVVAAMVLATSTLAHAAPRQKTVGKARRAVHAKAVTSSTPARRSVVKARFKTTTVRNTPAARKPPAVRKTSPAVRNTSAVPNVTVVPNATVVPNIAVVPKTTLVPKTTVPLVNTELKAGVVEKGTHNVKAHELQIKRLNSNVKAAEKARDWKRASSDRRVMYQLEADVRADKADSRDQLRAASKASKKSRIPFWGWWR
jgi:TolB-like protein